MTNAVQRAVSSHGSRHRAIELAIGVMSHCTDGTHEDLMALAYKIHEWIEHGKWQ